MKQIKPVNSNLFYSNKFTLFRFLNIDEFASLSFAWKQKELKNFSLKNLLDLFYDETEGTEPANENKEDSRS